MDNQSNVNANEIVNQLYAWVEKQCSKVSDKNSCYFRSVHEQIDVLRFKYLIDLNQWYNEQFVPTMRCYQSNNSKSRSKAETYRIMAEMYTHSEMESMYEKGFELINKALRYAPFSSKNVISSCFNIRSELHQKLGEENLRSASKDIWNALHFRPKSFSSIEQQVHLLEKLNQRSDAYRLVRDSCLFEPSSFTTNKMARLMEMKDVLAQYEFEPSKEVETVAKDLTVQEVKIDSRVDIVRNSDNQRLSFRANENIKPSTELIVEQPSMIILKRNGLKSYCNRCCVQCERTFFPCYGCIDIVFCSKECSELDTNHHQFECGIICLIHNHIATKAHHVYRLLTTMEPSNLVSMDKLFKGYSPESYWNQIRKDKIVKVKTEQMQNWFQIAQNDLRRQVERRQPLRSASELTVAILVLCLYRYQLNLDSFGVKNDDELSYLIAILATEMAKVTLTEFGWHDYVGNDRRSLASFQCLIASNINHSCEYNSTWDYSNGRLIIRSERSITNGESITITYGSLQSKPLYKRLNHVQCFSVMCYCNKCRRDVKKQFAFRCDNCSFEKNNSNSEHCGPVPYDPNEFTELVCMRCELRWTYAPKAQDIMGEFLSTRKMVWLLNGIDNTQMTNERANNKLNDDNGGDQLILLDDVCKQMDRLAGYIYPHQEQWLTMVSDLCLLLIEHSMYSKAVDWFQWFVDRFNIYLFNVKSDDSLKKYFLLDQWTTAYLGYLIHTNSVNVDCDSLNEFEMKYIRTSEKLFEQTFAVIDKILTRTDLDRLFLPSIKTYSMVRSLHESSIAKLKQFKDITQSRFEIPPPLAEIVPDDELEDELEFIETADDPVEERPTNLIDLSNVKKPELVVTKPSNPLVQQTQQQFGEELIEQNSFSSGDDKDAYH
ncbi:hypothetical protein BLOT_002660 [Blomia tropicalis]|nr:hypothetical protein BLOT_002660 [Blomia tropicalis]